MPGSLANKVAVITGGASGIGAATARRFADEGAVVIIGDRDADKGQAVADAIGAAAHFVATDVSVEQDMAELVAHAVDDHGRIDCLFSNAGFGGALGPIGDTSEADFDLTFDVLVKSVFFGMKHAGPVMAQRGQGSIINTASIAALQAGWSPHLYMAAKSAVIALTRSVAMELGDAGVRVNAICPGAIATPLLAGYPNADEAAIDAARTAFATVTPIGRIGEPEDLAAMALFLASDESSFVTGQAFVVDGGASTGTPWAQWAPFMREARPIRHHRPDGR